MAELTIEPLSKANAEDLVALLERVEGRHFAHTSRASVLRFLSEPDDVHVMGRSDGEAVAFGMMRGWHEGYEVPALGLAVRSDQAGRGFGRAMMEALVGIARERGASRIRLRVHPDNMPARRLYTSCGYREIGIERGELLMLLDVPPVHGDLAVDAQQREADTP